MNTLLAVGVGIAVLFFLSIVIVFLSSWILGRSRGNSAYTNTAQHYSRHEFEELEDSFVRSAKSSTVKETPTNNAMENSLIHEILSVDLSEEVPSDTHASAQTSLNVEKAPKNPLVSFIEEFEFSEDGNNSASDLSTKTSPEEDPFKELLGKGEDELASKIIKVENRSCTSYPDCFGNRKNCNKNCDFAEECKRTLEILGEFI